MGIEAHIGHRITVTRYGCDRGIARCETCDSGISFGTCVPLTDEDDRQPGVQVVTGVLRPDMVLSPDVHA